MGRYILRRIGQMVPTVIGVVLLTFLLFNVAGGDLAVVALGKNVSPKMLQEFDEQRGLDKPLFFGFRARSRAWPDTDFRKNAGPLAGVPEVEWLESDGCVKIAPRARVKLAAFALSPQRTYEWVVTYRGSGRIAGHELPPAKEWRSERIEFRGGGFEGIETGDRALFIRRLRLFRRVENPFDSQFVFYLRRLARFDLGYSESFKQPVTKLLKDGILPSLSITVPIFIIGLVSAVSLALICAWFRDTWIDRSLVFISVALMSINYLVYIVAGQYLLAYKLGWFPVWGYRSWRYVVLPVLIGVVSGLGANIRFYRTIMLDEMYKDYVRTAFAKGVPKRRVLFVHVLKNAMIPIITNVVIAIPFLYTGSLLLESFFGIPGLGYLSINAILSSDIDVVRALVLIGALLFVVANLLTDLCYAAVDPRVKLR